MMRLHDVVETSRRVSETRSRLEKVGLLAELLKRLEPGEMAAAVSFLSGELRQDRIGIGFSTLQKATPTTHADTPSLTLRDVEGLFPRHRRGHRPRLE